MNSRKLAFAASMIFSLLSIQATLLLASAESMPSAVPDQSYVWEKEIFVPMRDGIHLSTDVLRPKGISTPLPTVLVRTPYDKDRVEWAVHKYLLEKYLARGYAVVLQNERGRWMSEGYYGDYLIGSHADGVDTLNWIAKQPWSNGKVGSFGCSSSAETQWGMASANPPALAAMLPLASGTGVGSVPGNDTQGAIYRGGVPGLGLWTWWYHDMVPSERLVLPSNSTQEQRIRLRNGYMFQPTTAFYNLRPDGSLDWLSPKGDPMVTMGHLPSGEVTRVFGGPLTPFEKYITWTPADPRWRTVETIKDGEHPRVPAIHFSTWHDVGVGETTRLFKYLQDLNTADQYLIIGAGPHCALEEEARYADYTFGDLKLGDIRYRGIDHGYEKLYLDWFDHWVAGKDNGVTNMPHVQLMVMHGGWLMGDRYPLPQTRFTPFYLASPTSDRSFDTGVLAPKVSSGVGSASFVYDPLQPTPSRGGGCCDENNAVDQRSVEVRKDVLLYTSPPLDSALTIAGPVSATLYVSSTAKDTDFMIKLVDVSPDGTAVNLNDDAFRVRYREGFDKKVLMSPGQVYKITLTNMVTAVRFGVGHRIRLEIASSNFPTYERNRKRVAEAPGMSSSG